MTDTYTHVLTPAERRTLLVRSNNPHITQNRLEYLVEITERAAVEAYQQQRRVAGTLREPINGDGWKVIWWNESMRLMLPDGLRLDHWWQYSNGTMQLTIKAGPVAAPETAND